MPSTVTDNLKIYNALKQPPKEALRQIQGGRLSGKTDINPQWRYKAMTEQFGVCGIGWKYEHVKIWNEQASDGQLFAFAMVNVYIKQADVWSDPIPGCGGSMLVEKEKAGLHANDEGYKMAITDALSTAMKMLGVAADVYAGLWDGAKYRDSIETIKAPTSPVSKEVVPEATKQPQDVVTATTGAEKQSGEVIHRTVKDLVDIAKEKGYDSSNVSAIIIREFKKAKASELTGEQIDWLYDQMKEGKLKVEGKKEK